MEQRNFSEHSDIYQHSLRKRLWPSETCLTLLGAHFLNSVLEEKTDKDNINSNLYRLSESQSCNLFIEHLGSDQQVWRTFKLVMQCCSCKNKGVFTSHNLTLRLAAPKRPEVISFQRELAISWTRLNALRWLQMAVWTGFREAFGTSVILVLLTCSVFIHIFN